jgi:hypothetical protein
MISDNMMQFELRTPADVALELRDRVRTRRLSLNMSQVGLAERSGVKIALVLDFLGDFDHVGVGENKKIESRSLDDVLASSRRNERRRGRER